MVPRYVLRTRKPQASGSDSIGKLNHLRSRVARVGMFALGCYQLHLKGHKELFCGNNDRKPHLRYSGALFEALISNALAQTLVRSFDRRAIRSKLLANQ